MALTSRARRKRDSPIRAKGDLLSVVSSFENHIAHPIGRVQSTRKDHGLARQPEVSQHPWCRADLSRVLRAAHRFVARNMRNIGTRVQRPYLASTPEGRGSRRASITMPASSRATA
jgi:hypothetical protein